MYKDLDIKLFRKEHEVCIDDYNLPALLPTFYRVTGKTSPVIDFRTNMIFKREQFESLCDEIISNSRVLVYEVIENTRMQRLIQVDNFLFSLIYSLGDTDKARENRNKSEFEYDIPEELDEFDSAVLMKADDDKRLSVQDEEFKYIVGISMIYPQEDKSIAVSFLEKYDRIKYGELKIKAQDSIYTIGATQSGLTLLKHKMDTKNYENDILESNYNEDFNTAYGKLVGFLGEKNTSGLVLFKGKPGTGKSSLLIHLTTLSEKLNIRFVFVPSSFTHILSEPSFLTFAVANLKNSVLIFEDAEEALVSRGGGSNSAVTNILNMSDGILGKILNIKLIATINREENIDSALKRKGRLKLDYNFDLLSIDKANELLVKLSIDQKVTKPTSLADIYNIDKDPVVGNSTIHKKMGF